MISFRHITLLFFTLLLAPSLLFAATLKELQDLVEKEEFEQAYLMAKAMSKDQMGQADFDFLYGLASRSAGHPEVAVFALERVLMLNPTDARTMYEHARALIDVNDLKGAAQEFKNVLAMTTITDELKTNTTTALNLVEEAIRAQDRGTSFSFVASLDSGFNSNVNSGTNGPPVFPIQGPEERDGFINFSATALIKHNFSKDTSLYVSLANDNRKHFQSQVWDYNSITANAGPEFSLGQSTLRFPFNADVNFTGYLLDRINASFVPEFSFNWNELNLTSASFGFGTKLFTQDASNNYYILPVSLSHWTGTLIEGAGISTSLTYNPGIAFLSRNASTVVHSEVIFAVAASVEVATAHFLAPSFNIMYLRYPVSSTGNGGRNDINLTTQISYEWRFTESWALTSSFSYNYGYSTDPGQTYQRFQPQVGMRYQL